MAVLAARRTGAVLLDLIAPAMTGRGFDVYDEKQRGETMSRIRISLGEVVVTAELNESNTARLIAQALPFESKAQLWGDEVYFSIPVSAEEEDPQTDVPSGTMAYWPPGRALCLFFGQTPYSPVSVVGHIEGDPKRLAVVKDGQGVSVVTS